MDIRVDDLSGPEIAALLSEHLRSMYLHSPPESVHALDIERLRRPEITMCSAWADGELLGCAALKELDPHHGEIKSLPTATRHLRKGVATALLRHILAQAKRRSYRRLRLESRSTWAFAAGRARYCRFRV